MSRISLLALPILALAAFSFAAEPEAKPEAPKPNGLTATLINNKESYTLKPAQSGADFRKSLTELDKAPHGAPPASVVSLTLRITNPSDHDITINLGGDESNVTFTLTGEGAVTVDNMVAMTMDFRMGNPVTIKPGKTHDIPLTSLAGGMRGIGKMSYYTEAGEYKLAATLTAASGEKQVTIVSDTIKIKVIKPDAK